MAAGEFSALAVRAGEAAGAGLEDDAAGAAPAATGCDAAPDAAAVAGPAGCWPGVALEVVPPIAVPLVLPSAPLGMPGVPAGPGDGVAGVPAAAITSPLVWPPAAMPPAMRVCSTPFVRGGSVELPQPASARTAVSPLP